MGYERWRRPARAWVKERGGWEPLWNVVPACGRRCREENVTADGIDDQDMPDHLNHLRDE